jgi:tripartite-type tricarboxylate transporter receptor subunit TctC
MKIVRGPILKAIAAAAVALSTASALAQSYPTRSIRLIVPFPPGGATDIIARAVAVKLPLYLGQHLVVDNRSGAGGVIGAQLLARAAPDGYTLGVATVSTMAAAPAMDPKVPYSPMADFTPIINIAATPNVLVVHPSFPAQDFNVFITEVRRHPKHYSYASSGEGGLGHMLMALFQNRTGTSLLHVPYKGGGPAMNALVGGHVALMIANLPTALPHIKAKRLVAIAVAGDMSVGAMLEVPTFEQLNLPDVNRPAFYGICGPKGLPLHIVNSLHAAVKRTLADPQVFEAIAKTGSVVIGNSPEQFREQIRTELETYKGVVPMLKARQ